MVRAVTAASIALKCGAAQTPLVRALERESHLKLAYIYDLEFKVFLGVFSSDGGPAVESARALLAASVAPPEDQPKQQQPAVGKDAARALAARLQTLERDLELINAHVEALEEKLVELGVSLAENAATASGRAWRRSVTSPSVTSVNEAGRGRRARAVADRAGATSYTGEVAQHDP